MASTVNILCPNGRRFNLKVAPNDTVMQVLERVCSKGSFSPNEYDLKHQRSVLDVTVTIRYANLPNLAKLEMVKRGKPRGESKVHIALQVESGERLAHDFKSDDTLMNLLTHWDSTNASYQLAGVKTAENQTLQPVCIYMRREIIGEAWLRHTTLKSLGLTSGKAVIRHMHRAVELPAPPAAPTNRERPSSSEPHASLPPTPTAVPSPPEYLGESSSDGRKEETRANSEEMDTTNSTEAKAARNVQTDENFGKMAVDGEQPMEVDETTEKGMADTEQKLVPSNDGGISNKEHGRQDHSGARPKSSPAGGSTRRGQSGEDVAMAMDSGAPSVESFLQSHGAAGVELDKRTKERIEQLMKREEEMMQQMNEVAQQLKAQQMAPSIKPAIGAAPSTSTSAQLRDFKFPDAPKRKVTSENPGTSKDELSKPCDRRVLVFSASDAVPTGEQFQELPDGFFNVTAEDMRRALSDLKSQQASDRPLETKAMREARKKKQMSKYSKATVRVHFPDHLMVQAFFRPQEKVSALYEFVQECLDGKDKDFYLYTTPPKTVLKNKNETLFEAKLFPAAVVYFGSGNLDAPYLSDATLQKRVTLAEAEVTAFDDNGSMTSSSSSQSESTNRESSSASGSEAAPGPSQSKRRPPSQPGNQSAAASSKGGQVPKWFKNGRR